MTNAKLYTLDNALLGARPEVRVGDRCYPVDCRQKTVRQMMVLADPDSGLPPAEAMDEAMKLALGDDAYRELLARDLPFAAWQQLFSLVVAAATVVEPDGGRPLDGVPGPV